MSCFTYFIIYIKYITLTVCINDANDARNVNNVFKDIEDDNDVVNTPMNDDVSKFYGYVEDANEVMHPGHKFTKSSVSLHLFYINVSTNLWLRRDMLLDL